LCFEGERAERRGGEVLRRCEVVFVVSLQEEKREMRRGEEREWRSELRRRWDLCEDGRARSS
jgi:hypothetical protein